MPRRLASSATVWLQCLRFWPRRPRYGSKAYEFGLVGHEGETKAYGAGLLSSYGELEHAFSNEVERRPFDLEEVINHDYTYSDMQPVLYVIPSYAELKEATRKYIESF